MTAPASVVVLISGRGSNMQSLVERGREAGSPYRVSAVISDRADAGGLAIARDFGLPALAVEPTAPRRGPAAATRAAYDAELAEAIEGFSPSLIALAGFMRILSAPFVARFEGRALNIHPSLLPRHPGLDTHRRVLEAHEREHGATVHFVTAELDGGPRVIQGRLEVEPQETAQHLAMRVHALEHRIYPMAVAWFCSGRLREAQGRAWLDGEVLSHPVVYESSSQGAN